MGAVREDMDDERDKHRETFCFASLCYVRDHSSTDVQSRHCPSRATTVAVHKSCGGCHTNHDCHTLPSNNWWLTPSSITVLQSRATTVAVLQIRGIQEHVAWTQDPVDWKDGRDRFWHGGILVALPHVGRRRQERRMELQAYEKHGLPHLVFELSLGTVRVERHYAPGALQHLLQTHDLPLIEKRTP